MSRFRLHIEYQGTRYSGWQIQTNARTVQGVLCEAIRKVTGEPEFELYGAGRTDAGVHALCQVAHLELKTALTPGILRMKINDELPADINVLLIAHAPQRFHARHHAISRSYLYQISRRRTAFGKKLVWWIKDELDLQKMRQAATLFPGMKNCESFAADDPGEKSVKALITGVKLGEAGDLILIRIEGSHFLWRMVRRIVGVIVEVGKGKLSLDEVREFFKTKSEKPAQLTAPPSGLFLEGVYYEGDSRPAILKPVMLLEHRGKNSFQGQQ